MLTDIHPKLPMRDKVVTRDYYINKLGFQEFGNANSVKKKQSNTFQNLNHIPHCNISLLLRNYILTKQHLIPYFSVFRQSI